MRKKIVAGNWKMFKTFDEGVELIKEVLDLLSKKDLEHIHVIFATPFIHLKKAAKETGDTKHVAVAAQNCHWEDSGAFTGEISVPMLKSTGTKYVIIGHSERRQYFKEDHEQLKKKTDAVLKHGLHPIFCVGEALAVREAGKHFDLIKQQLEESLFHLSADQFQSVVIAYEPVWAIGTGVTASKEQAQEMHAFIRNLLNKKYGSEAADNTSILYGGSCKPSNAKELFEQADVDGGLIGGASLVAGDFVAIVKSF